jgi:hypothetical protein
MYKLFIDESGKNTLRKIDPNLPFFSMSGVIVHKDNSEAIRIKADQIKFKYWGKMDVVFRATNLRRLTGDFDIFVRPTKFNLDDFYVDFINLITNSSIRVIWVGMNKAKYISNNPPIKNAVTKVDLPNHGHNWDKMVSGIERKIIKDFTNELLTVYLCHLIKKKDWGQVIMEASDAYQDIGILTAYNELMVRGHTPLNMTSSHIRDFLTAISFVTKKNRDIESQLADIVAHYLNLDAKANDGISSIVPGSYEHRVIEAIKVKIFNYKNHHKQITCNSYIRKI